jgi:RNA polymerase sigma-70 factor, ECF subfamily
MTSSLQRLYDEAQARHANLRPSFENFCRRIAALTGEEALPPERVDDVFLACACEEGDAAALDDFERRLMPTARLAISKVTRVDDLIEESVQELRRRLFCQPDPKIALYGGRGPLWKWLRITATRAALDVVKAGATRPSGGEEVVDHLLRDELDPDLHLIRERYEDVFRRALREAVANLTPQQRTILRLRYVENQGIDRLAVPFKAHRATVARWLQEIREQILGHVHRRLEEHVPKVSQSEAHSLWRAVRSQVHFSFARLVDEPED